MSRKVDELLLKRGRLIERIDGQRAALRQDFVPVAQSLATVDRGVAGVQAGLAYVHRHALAFSAIAGTFLLFRGKSTLRWSARAFSLHGLGYLFKMAAYRYLLRAGHFALAAAMAWA